VEPTRPQISPSQAPLFGEIGVRPSESAARIRVPSEYTQSTPASLVTPLGVANETTLPVRARSWLLVLRTWSVAFWTLSATVLFYRAVAGHFPVQHWLLIRYLGLWVAAAFFFISTWSFGHLVVGKLLTVPARASERVIYDFSVGALVFATGVFLAGIAGQLGQKFFYIWPGLLLGLGLPSAWASLRRWNRRLRKAGLAAALPKSSPQVLALTLLALGCLALYLQVLLPTSIGGDAHGYHLPIAEHYVAEGAIRPFSEGWYLGAYPQLASLLYTWALLSPGSGSFQTSLASQLEWVFFVMTLFSIGPLVRRLTKIRVPFSASALFLFPGIFLYDSNLITTADHVLAFFTLPLALSLSMLARRFHARESALVALILSAGLLTKYHGYLLLFGSLPFVLFLSLRHRRLVPLLVLAVVGLVSTSSHWAKNWVFYDNPVYPFLSDWFPSRPFHTGARELFVSQGPVPVPPARTLGELLSALWSFSFQPDGLSTISPRFGSLFTLCVPLLLLVKARLRLWLCVLMLHACLLLWLSSYAADRFLQIFLPLMAAATAAILRLSWSLGRPARAGVALLVGFQLVWGADIYFSAEHRWIKRNVLSAFIDHVAMGQQGRHEARDAAVGSLVGLRERLPEGSKLLVHGLLSGQLGAGTRLVGDEPGWQGAISYLELNSPEATSRLWQQLGVTHSVWHYNKNALNRNRLAEELIFRRTIHAYGEDLGTIGGRRFFALKTETEAPSLAQEETRIAWLACDLLMKSGIYEASGLAKGRASQWLSDVFPRTPGGRLGQANALLIKDGCNERRLLSSAPGEFKEVGRAAELSLWIRTKRPPDEPSFVRGRAFTSPPSPIGAQMVPPPVGTSHRR
jgi:hypothetical protein